MTTTAVAEPRLGTAEQPETLDAEAAPSASSGFTLGQIGLLMAILAVQLTWLALLAYGLYAYVL